MLKSLSSFDSSALLSMVPACDDTDDVTQWTDADLRRVVRCHRRAVIALEGFSFKGISQGTAQKLRARLRENMELMEEELARRDLVVEGVS